MSASAAVLATFGSDELNAKVYGSLSSASNLLLNIKTKGQIIIFSAKLWQLNSRLETLMTDLKAVSEGKLQVQPQEPITPERSEHAISSLEQLGRMLAYIYEQSRRRGFTNNSVIAGSLRRMNNYSECLLDVADWLHVLIQPEGVEDIFTRAEEEKNRGEIVSIN